MHSFLAISHGFYTINTRKTNMETLSTVHDGNGWFCKAINHCLACWLHQQFALWTCEYKIECFTIEKIIFNGLLQYKWRLVQLVVYNLQFKRNNKCICELNNTNLAVINQYFCQQCNRILNLPDKRSLLQTDEHKYSSKCGNVRRVKRIERLLANFFSLNLQHYRDWSSFWNKHTR